MIEADLFGNTIKPEPQPAKAGVSSLPKPVKAKEPPPVVKERPYTWWRSGTNTTVIWFGK